MESIIIMIKAFFISSFALLFSISGNVFADTMAKAIYFTDLFGNSETIDIATGHTKTLRTAPVVASVITMDDIKKMPATNFHELLQSIPGLHVSRMAIGYTPSYRFNGMHSQGNTSLLVMVDGVISAPTGLGGRLSLISEINIEDIFRIEILRGPGSSLYGADAFIGVINIVTKGANEENLKDAGIELNNFGDGKLWGHHSINNTYGSINFSYTAGIFNSEKIKYNQDGQSFYDSLLGTNASLAPKKVDYSFKSHTLQLDWKKGNSKAQIRWHSKWDHKVGMSIVEAIVPESNKVNTNILETIYRYNRTLKKDFMINTNIGFSYLENSKDKDSSNLLLYPPGSFNNAFPDGVVHENYSTELFLQSNIDISYKSQNNLFTFGIGYNVLSILSAEHYRNFNIDSNGIPIPLGNIQDLSSQVEEALDQDRKNIYLFLQDEWHALNDIDIIFGVRFDKYSDFGNYFSPRTGIVWNFDYNKTAKLLYGRSFKAPSHLMLFSPDNSGIMTGNRNLKPQSLDMVQAILNHNPSSSSSIDYSIFYYRLNNLLDFSLTGNSSFFNNKETQIGYGVQFEYTQKLKIIDLQANYSYQHAETETGDVASIYTPDHMFYLRGYKPITSKFSLSTDILYNSRKKLPDVHSVGSYKGFFVVNTKFTYEFSKKMRANLFLKNIFNKNAYYAGMAPGAALPDGIPIHKRSYHVNFSYAYN